MVSFVRIAPSNTPSCPEPTAQCNHQNEGGKRPAICPWRIEVGDPGQGARTMFLDVFEITNENDQAPTAIKLIETAGIQIGDTWQVGFNYK